MPLSVHLPSLLIAATMGCASNAQLVDVEYARPEYTGPSVYVATSGPPCGELAPGEGMGPGSTLTSCDGELTLAMQTDGNLVLYKGEQLSSNALWATGTDGAGGFLALMQQDGNFVLYNDAGVQPSNAQWSSGTWNHAGARLAVDNDQLVVALGGRRLWTSTIGDRQAARR